MTRSYEDGVNDAIRVVGEYFEDQGKPLAERRPGHTHGIRGAILALLDTPDGGHMSEGIMSFTARDMLENAGCASQRKELCDDPVVNDAILRSVAQFIQLNWACTPRDLIDHLLLAANTPDGETKAAPIPPINNSLAKYRHTGDLNAPIPSSDPNKRGFEPK